jgi:hypothetical protein
MMTEISARQSSVSSLTTPLLFYPSNVSKAFMGENGLVMAVQSVGDDITNILAGLA